MVRMIFMAVLFALLAVAVLVVSALLAMAVAGECMGNME